MGLETGTYISDLVSTNPAGGDDRSTSDDHHRLIKATILASFPNITGAMTATQTELNAISAMTASRALQSSSGGAVEVSLVTATELGYLDGVTSALQTQLTGKSDLTLSNLSNTTTARSNLGLGALAVLATVDTAQIDALAVETAQLGAGAVTRSKLATTTVTTLAGTLGQNGSQVNITLTAYSFFPMIHSTAPGADTMMQGHSTDGASADSPRFSLRHDASSTDDGSYDVDYRYVAA